MRDLSTIPVTIGLDVLQALVRMAAPQDRGQQIMLLAATNALNDAMPPKHYRVAPVDADFAGWCEVEEGQHNGYAVIDNEGAIFTFIVDKAQAEAKAKELNNVS